MSPKKSIEAIGAIGVSSKSGGTYAHNSDALLGAVANVGKPLKE